jgi:hypothetical protein
LNNSSKPYLLRIVGYVGAKAEDHAAVMAIRTLDDFWFLHVPLQRINDDLEAFVI